MFSNPIGQVLRSRCHLYFFSFPPRTRLCPLTRGGTARLLGLGPFSLQLEKGSSRGPAAPWRTARRLSGRAGHTVRYSTTRRAARTFPRSLGTGCPLYFSLLKRLWEKKKAPLPVPKHTQRRPCLYVWYCTTPRARCQGFAHVCESLSNPTKNAAFSCPML